MGIVGIPQEFERRCDACTTLAQLVPVVGDAGREIGFDHFALTLCDNLSQTDPRFAHFDDYPAVYAERFVARQLWRLDPVLHVAQRRIGGFRWRNVRDLLPIRPEQLELLDQAGREGLRDGYTIPANVPGEPCGAVSFASRRELRLTDELRSCADCIARTAFEASRRLRGLSARPSPVPHLNNREIQCLRRLILGETDKHVARALDISPNTVRQYVKRALRGYGAHTRAQLIALALRDSQILFDWSAIPPFGGTDPD